MNIHNERVDELKNRLKLALKIRSWKASDLSERTNIPKSAISYYLAGKSQPRQARLHTISVALDISEAWLLGYDVARERENNSDIILNMYMMGVRVRPLAHDVHTQKRRKHQRFRPSCL